MLLHVDALQVVFPLAGQGQHRAVDGVSLDIDTGETLGLVGESGCGKSTIARTIVGLVEPSGGAILIQGLNRQSLSPRQRRTLACTVQMVFQDPYASLNPRMTVHDTLAEPLRFHRRLRGAALSAEIAALMDRVGLARRFIRKYPHEFSGGQRQRIAIARALSVEPALLIADEPVSALDVSVQAQILNLLSELRRDTGLAMLFISHDLSVVRYLADRIAVMYNGRIVEEGEAEAICVSPQHEYTRALMRAIPRPPEADAARHTSA